MRRLYLLVAVLATILLGVPAMVSAVDYGGIGGRPAHPQPGNPRTESIFIYQLEPGHHITDGVLVFNSTQQVQDISVYAVDSVLSSDGAFACAQQVEAKKDVGSWITLEQNTVSLAPNSSLEVPFAVAVPDSAGVGEHDGCIAIQSAADAGAASSGGVTLSFRSAIRVAITIPGQIQKQLALSSVGLGGLQKNGTYRVTPTAKNDGNVSLDTKVNVKLVSLFGTASATAQGTYPVLPHSEASWNFELKRPFWGGLYRALVTVSYNGNTNTELGEQQNIDMVTKQTYSQYFVAMPEPLAAVAEAAVLLAVLALVMLFVVKNKRSRHVHKHWKVYDLEAGDTLESLAHDFHVSWRKIAQVNKLKPPYNLHRGQKLKLPPTEE